MNNIIRHIVEPTRLLLTWQSSDEAARTRFAVGQIEKSREIVFRYFSEQEFETLNGRPLAYVRELGFSQYPAFKPKSAVHVGVLDAFMRRLPPRKRADFDDYIRHFRIEAGLSVSDFALLGLTEAKLPSDGFAIVDPLDDTSSRRELVVEAVGHRHYAATCDLTGAVGEPVWFEPESNNPHDSNAVMVTARGQKIGYINRFQCLAFREWLRGQRVTGSIDRIDREHGHPRVHVFVRVKANAGLAAAE